MSKHYIFDINNSHKKYNQFKDMQYLLAKKLKINIKPKFMSKQKSKNKKFLLKIKLNYPLVNLAPNNFNKKGINKINNIISTTRKYNNFYIGNYKDKINPPLSSKKNFINDNLYLNNSINEKPKVILPSIKFINKKESLIQAKERSAIFRKKLKQISLADLFGDKNIDNIIPKRTFNLKKNNSQTKSEWNLLNGKLKDKSNDYLNFEDLTFNNYYRKFSDINREINNEYKSSEERHKNGAERLKEFQRQKISDCNKLIRKAEKESEEKKKILNKYLLLMRDNFENSIEFNTKFI